MSSVRRGRRDCRARKGSPVSEDRRVSSDPQDRRDLLGRKDPQARKVRPARKGRKVFKDQPARMARKVHKVCKGCRVFKVCKGFKVFKDPLVPPAQPVPQARVLSAART
jgi:hypothetical protein